MSPEQARGRPTDKRTDVWSFGCVLYEMLTGRRAFSGHDVAETLAAVLRAEPEWNALPPDVPPATRVLLRQCLKKDRRLRVSDLAAAQFAFELDGVLENAPASRVPLRRRTLVIGGLVATCAFATLLWTSFRSGERRPSVVRFAIALPSDQYLTGLASGSPLVAFSRW